MATLKVHDHLFVGDDRECYPPSVNLTGRWAAIVHAVKDPCHKLAVDYGGQKSLPAEHSEYLSAVRGERGQHLVLNLIDPPLPLFKPESFLVALDYLDCWTPHGDVLLHCNQGRSRAPSVALCWLAKRAKVLPPGSYREAYEAFLARCPSYVPGSGISTFLADCWALIQ